LKLSPTTRIREAVSSDAIEIARVHVDSRRATYAGILPDSLLSTMSYEESESRWSLRLRNPAIAAFVAEEDDSGEGAQREMVVGFASGGPEGSADSDYKGELYNIYLLRSHQRRGLGSLLTAAVAGELKRRNFESMLVWVLADNPSRRFYEALGGEFLRTREIERGGKKLSEVAYGWKNIEALETAALARAKKPM